MSTTDPTSTEPVLARQAGEPSSSRHSPITRTALPHSLPSLLRAGVLLSLAAPALAADTEFSYAAGTDLTGRAQAVSDAAGRVLIESPDFPRGLWVDLVDEAGQALAGIEVEYEGRPDSLVALRCVDPSGLRRETLLWTRPGGSPLRFALRPGEPADLPAGLTSIDWRVDPSAEGLLESSRLVGWEAVAGFIRQSWTGQDGMLAVRLDDVAVVVDMGQAEAIETLVRHLQETHQPVIESLENPIFGAAVYQGSDVLPPSGLILHSHWFEDRDLEAAVREALVRRYGRVTGRGVTSLTLLEVEERNIRSVVGLEYLTGLDTLNLKYNEIVDVSPLGALTSLEWLQLGYNDIVDVSPLASLTRLETLQLTLNDIVDMSPLATLANLQRLWLTGNLVDVSTLASLTSLEVLALAYSGVVDVSPLASLTRLRTLFLGNNGIVDVSPLAALTNLSWLDLSDNEIVDVSPLASLTRLRFFSLRNNELVDVSPLAALINLERLGLRDNGIVDVGSLAALTNLERLVLGSNKILDATPLAGLTSLELLELEDNQIQDIGPLVANTGLGQGDEVNLAGNPLSDQAINEQIPALEARGVKITY